MNTKIALPGFEQNQLSMFRIFHPYAFSKTMAAATSGTRFVHYTSADTAMRIFQTGEVWMRKSSCLNDFMEIQHGFECLNAAYKNQHDKFALTFERIFPGFVGKLEGMFNGWLPHFRSDTYIACISEHDSNEDEIGRLSMWRAYGGVSGVAIVMKGAPFLTPSDALKAYTSPVGYFDSTTFEHEFSVFLEGIQLNASIVQGLGEEAVLALVFGALRAAILCTKHVGFREEREWRIIYSPAYQKSDRIISDVQSIRGTPQPICRIPLKDFPDEGLVGIEIPKLVDRVIIGPTQYPQAIREAFITLLSNAGMTDAPNRVFVSDIPLRQ